MWSLPTTDPICHARTGSRLIEFLEQNLMPDAQSDKLKIWCLLDGKAGHQNQVLGLAEAIGRKRPAWIEYVELTGWHRGFRSMVHLDLSQLPDSSPDLIIGAGHASHMPLCVFRRRFGGKSIVLMKPTFPLAWFDFCLVPEVHRLRQASDNLIRTKGVLNRILPSTNMDTAKGLFLIGGPSPHYQWSDKKIVEQLASVVQKEATVDWRVATSRRTPENFFRLLKQIDARFTIIRSEDVSSDWLPVQLAMAGKVWVSEDSVSMTCEALTSGSQTGLLELTRNRSNRVTDCIDSFVATGELTRWTEWAKTEKLSRRTSQFCEAQRCTDLLLKHLPGAIGDKPTTAKVA